MKQVPIQEFLSDASPLLDVRSPSEYAAGHIPGAISFPLFSDEQRAQVGTRYKHEGQKKAIKVGLDYIGPQMSQFIEQAEALCSSSFRIHCWRGGMRSQSMAWLLDLYGFNTMVLKDGYKAYRNAIIEFFESGLKLKVVSGLTGTKKTLVLHALHSQGEQIIDLEGLAKHQGSSFGNVLTTGQPSTEQFQNNLYAAALELDPERSIWIEDESHMIGHCAMVRGLYLQKEASAHCVIDIPMKERIAHLVKDYGNVSKSGLIKATEGIRKRLGHQRADEAIDLINAGDLGPAVEIILSYYDRMYLRSIEAKKIEKTHYSFDHADVVQIAKTLIDGK